MCGYAPRNPNGYLAQAAISPRVMYDMLAEFGINNVKAE